MTQETRSDAQGWQPQGHPPVGHPGFPGGPAPAWSMAPGATPNPAVPAPAEGYPVYTPGMPGYGDDYVTAAPIGPPPAPAPAPAVSEPPAAAAPGSAPAWALPPALPEPSAGRGAWVPGKGWDPYADPEEVRWRRTPQSKFRKPRLLPGGPLGRLAVSATLGLLLFSAFGWHSWITNLVFSKHSLTAPPSVQGTSLVTTGRLAGVSNGIIDHMRTLSGVTAAVGGYYGDDGTGLPNYAMFAVRSSGRSLTSSDLTGIVDSISGGKYAAGITSDTRSGTKYTCGNYSYEGADRPVFGVACVWEDYDVTGMVISFQDANADRMLNTTQSVHDETEK